jgi:hypothetical protein|tara:strand:+ start:2071 stop:2949 length:879 start_codon:yes stop_codon:yes gene_type:complete
MTQISRSWLYSPIVQSLIDSRGVEWTRNALLEGQAEDFGIPQHEASFYIRAIDEAVNRELTTQQQQEIFVFEEPQEEVNAVADPSDPGLFYDDGYFAGFTGDDDTLVAQTAGGAGVALVSAGSLLGTQALAPYRGRILQLFTGWGLLRGARVAWSRLPGWFQTVLVALGVEQGVDLLIDVDLPSVGDVFELGGGLDAGDTVEIGRNTYTVASSWTANSVKFYRFNDGNLGVQNKHGVWKVWRPPKMVSLRTTGTPELGDLIKADKIVDKNAKKVARMLRGRGFQVRKTPKQT